MDLPPEAQTKLDEGKNIWIATMRPDGRPHLVPIWFVWLDHKIYLSIDPASVKARNIANNPEVALALEDGSHPVICQGEAYPFSLPIPMEVINAFFMKYDWDISMEKQYNQLVVVHPKKWLVW